MGRDLQILLGLHHVDNTYPVALLDAQENGLVHYVTKFLEEGPGYGRQVGSLEYKLGEAKKLAAGAIFFGSLVLHHVALLLQCPQDSEDGTLVERERLS